MLIVNTLDGPKQVTFTEQELLDIILYQVTQRVNPPSVAYKIIEEAILSIKALKP